MPLYQQIKDHIIDRIDNGHWAPGARIASENELVKELNAARMTVNRAIKELSEEGVLFRVAGVGTFVAEARLQHPAASIVEIRDEIERRGQRHQADVVTLCRDIPPRELAAALRQPTGWHAFHSVIIHRADRTPILLEDRWVNPRIAPDYLDEDFRKTTPTRHLLRHAPLQRVEQTIEAIAVDPSRAAMLTVETGDPALLVTRRTWTRDEVASLVHLFYVGERYILRQGADTLPAPTQLTTEKERSLAS